VGVAVMIEKGFQSGRDRLVEQGIDVFSGAIIKAFENNRPIFE
jgi:adenine/guanine phosphoribosyltransferase-like PRPP-binding protein